MNESTRFVTHFAAPGFFFLMGVGMLLFARSREEQGWNKGKIITHFFQRGLILILLQFLIINRIWELSPGGWVVDIYVGVLFALGGAMILASLLLWFPNPVLLSFSALLLIGMAFLVPEANLWGTLRISNQADYLNLLLLQTGGRPGPEFWSNYPILPWLPLVIFGMAFGQWFKADQEKAFKRALYIGAAFILGFIGLRFMGNFCNIRPMTENSWIHFLNLVKYPPSIVFILLTTGANLILLYIFSKVKGLLQLTLSPLQVYGKTPLFFYINHLLLYLAIGALFFPQGTSLALMYPLWLLGLVLLYPSCLWFSEIKKRQSPNSALRFF